MMVFVSIGQNHELEFVWLQAAGNIREQYTHLCIFLKALFILFDLFFICAVDLTNLQAKSKEKTQK